ncbi:MAG: hypothetical protein R3F33_17730 [Planctomycetota bacterium]
MPNDAPVCPGYGSAVPTALQPYITGLEAWTPFLEMALGICVLLPLLANAYLSREAGKIRQHVRDNPDMHWTERNQATGRLLHRLAILQWMLILPSIVLGMLTAPLASRQLPLAGFGLGLVAYGVWLLLVERTTRSLAEVGERYRGVWRLYVTRHWAYLVGAVFAILFLAWGPSPGQASFWPALLGTAVLDGFLIHWGSDRIPPLLGRWRPAPAALDAAVRSAARGLGIEPNGVYLIPSGLMYCILRIPRKDIAVAAGVAEELDEGDFQGYIKWILGQADCLGKGEWLSGGLALLPLFAAAFLSERYEPILPVIGFLVFLLSLLLARGVTIWTTRRVYAVGLPESAEDRRGYAHGLESWFRFQGVAVDRRGIPVLAPRMRAAGVEPDWPEPPKESFGQRTHLLYLSCLVVAVGLQFSRYMRTSSNALHHQDSRAELLPRSRFHPDAILRWTVARGRKGDEAAARAGRAALLERFGPGYRAKLVDLFLQQEPLLEPRGEAIDALIGPEEQDVLMLRIGLWDAWMHGEEVQTERLLRQWLTALLGPEAGVVLANGEPLQMERSEFEVLSKVDQDLLYAVVSSTVAPEWKSLAEELAQWRPELPGRVQSWVERREQSVGARGL